MRDKENKQGEERESNRMGKERRDRKTERDMEIWRESEHIDLC